MKQKARGVEKHTLSISGGGAFMQEGWIQDCVSERIEQYANVTIAYNAQKLRIIKDEHGELVT